MFCREVFATFDPADKGWIEFADFVQAINILSTRALYDQLGRAFRIFDRNESGEIDKEELLDVIAYLTFLQGGDISPNDMIDLVDKIFDEIDIDGDGVLTKDEFLRGVIKCQELAEILTTV
jgi:Ca2+-binding EF-hand superfamily protein